MEASCQAWNTMGHPVKRRCAVDETERRPWREACEAALCARSREDALRHWGIGHEADAGPCPPFDYRLEHTRAVVRVARWLAARTGADAEVVECAAWLHDCEKRLRDSRERDHHAQSASTQVADILQGTDFPASKIPAVRDAIEQHVGLKLSRRLQPLAAACLWDADTLSKLGAASIVHFTCISGSFQPVDTRLILERGERWIGLARGIVESLNTAPAQAEGRRRFAFLCRHYAQLRLEWSDPMEESPA